MAKGGSYEREVCDLLSLWWCGDPDRRIFWRSHSSGGMATVRSKKGKSSHLHCGDIYAMDPAGQPLIDLFAIEVKRGYNADTWHTELDRPPRKQMKPQAFERWVVQAADAADNSGAPYWLLVTRRDKKLPLVTLLASAASDLMILGSLLSDRAPSATLRVAVDGVWQNLVCLCLADFLTLVKPQRVTEIARILTKARRVS
jgi:hypothetical protein